MIRKKTLTAVASIFLMMGLVACNTMGKADSILYSKYVTEKGKFDHGELLQNSREGEKLIDNVCFETFSNVDDNTIVGCYWEGPGTDRYVATYDIEEKKLTKITKIGYTIEDQRVTMTDDGRYVFYGDKELGAVKYDISKGELKTVAKSEDLSEPSVTRDGKTMFYIKDMKLLMGNVKSRSFTTIASSGVHTYALSNDGKFIIFSRIDYDRDYNSTLYKYDIESGEETKLMSLNKQIRKISISSDNTRFAYVTYSNAYFSEWAKTILHVCDLKTLRSKVVYKSASSDNVDDIILR